MQYLSNLVVTLEKVPLSVKGVANELMARATPVRKRMKVCIVSVPVDG